MSNTTAIHKTKIPSSQREISENSDKKESSYSSTGHEKKSLSKWLIILIVVAAILIIAIVGAFIFKKIKDQKNRARNEPTDIPSCNQNSQNENIDNKCKNDLSKKEALKAFESKFKISSKTNHLNQVFMKSNLKSISISNGVESTTLSTFTKAKFDLYTLNESLSIEDSKDFYSRKYYTVITMNSMCNSFYSNKSDCDLEEYLDLNVKHKNLRTIDEENLELIKKLILPICIIEHTDTNIIISVTCPETLSSNLKEDIIASFKIIKPQTFKGIIEDDSISNTNINKKDNRNYIDSFVKGCDEPSINLKCEEIKNIVTDLDGNLISMKQNSTKEIIKDEDHKNKQIKTYYIEDNSNSENFDSNNYKKNLDNVFELIKPYMKKEDYISLNLFKVILENLMKGDSNTTKNVRSLIDEKTDNSGSFEATIFSKDIYGINIELNMKNDIGIEKNSMAKIMSIITTGKEKKDISLSQKSIKLNETMDEFIGLTKAAKSLAKPLQEELNEKILELRNDIDSNFNDLNNLLSFEDILPIFDSTLSISGISSIPYTLVSTSENLYSNFIKINNDISSSIYDYKNNLKRTLSSFLAESHQLLYYIFSNLTESTNLLSSKKSKIAEIYSYYLNNTDTSFVDIIQKAKEILLNYNINEKRVIQPLVDKMLNEFYNDSIISTEKEQKKLDILVEQLDSQKLNINLGNKEDSKNVIDNINNSKMKVIEILKGIVDIFNNSIGYQDSGYFESQKDLDANIKSYGQVTSDAIKIANTLDNNLLIDTTFDKMMKYFRDQFVVLLNYMEILKRERFPLKENVLGNSTFTKENIDQIDQDFYNDKSNILKFIKNENKEYLDFVKESIDKYKKDNLQNLENYLSNIRVVLSNDNLDNLTSIYNEMLYYSFNQIDTFIKDNNDLAIDYLKNVKNAGSVHCTSGFKKKYNIYINNLNILMNYVELNLKKNLVNKYKNVIDQIRSFLQKIKTNSIIEKYKIHFSFSEAHLRIIDNLFIAIDEYISDKLFNKNYLPIINNYISNTLKKLNNLAKNLDSLYSEIKNLPGYDIDNDYTKTKQKCEKCCKSYFIFCWKYGECCEDYTEGNNIGQTNNHLKLKTIDFNQFTIEFDKFYDPIYNQVSNNINNYCNSLNSISTIFDSKKNEFLSKNVNYLNSFSKNFESILNNYLGFNLLTSTYNYYKNELDKKIPNVLDDILSKWNEVYDKIDEDLNSNLNNFKSSIREFGFLADFYYETYRENISYGYVDSIIQERKNDLNYTIKYYYNMISFKVNKTFSYIMNNIPINDKPFDEILNTRILQIKNIYNDIITKIQTSKNHILSRKVQLAFLKVSETNFFLINDYINDNVDKIDEELLLRYSKLFDTSNKLKIKDNEEIAISKFYIEIAQNGKQIKYINEPINRATFTDLQSDVYQSLIEEIFEIEKDELIKSISNSLKESNEKIIQSYKYEKDKYSEIIQNKIYKSFYDKENLLIKIKNIYNNSLIDLNEDSKNIIYGYLDQVLDNIKNHIINETAILNDEATSYSNNYTVIESTLNEYKEKIYNGFYSKIISVVEDFHNQIKDRFYTNYIEKCLKELRNQKIKKNCEDYKFLNTTINLNKTINETVELLINEYQSLAMSQIEHLYNKNIQKLELLFSFSSMKNKTYNEIDNIYNSVLLPTLKEKAIYKSGDYGIKDYNFSSEISSNIDSILNTSLQNTEDIINQMNNSNIEEDWDIPDFSLVSYLEFKNIENSFDNFTQAHSNEENKQFKDVIFENLKNNFNIFINNFIPSFGIDYFERILKYNEIQKIKSLYSNLKYSLIQTLVYYLALCTTIDSKIKFPDDLKSKILSLNGLESTISSNNIKILSSLNSKFQEFIKKTKNYIVDKYIDEIKNDPSINKAFEFNNEIVSYIRQILDGQKYIFESEYINKMNDYIKNPFIQEYEKTLNKETNEMLYFVEENKDVIKPYLNEKFTLKPDEVLSKIENKLNNTLKAIEVYNLHLNSFNIPDSIKKFLEKYVSNTISPKYEQINIILNSATKEINISNLELNSENYQNSYNSEEFESKNKEINTNLTNSFNKIIESLKSYGTIEDNYSKNLKNGISKYNKIRNLDESDDDKIAYNRKIADAKLDEIFQEIKNSSANLKQFIESLNLFKEFEEKLNKYKNDLNYQCVKSENTIEKNNDYYNVLNNKLYELKMYSLQYYERVNSSYHKTKELILESIDTINELIENCTNTTFETLAKEYEKIKENYDSIIYENNETSLEAKIYEYNEILDGKNYSLESKMINYITDNKIKLDIIFEDGDNKKPKIVGTFINKNRPENWEIDVYSKTGQDCGRLGWKVIGKMNNISLAVDLKFDGVSNEGSFNKKTEFDEYTITNYLYEKIEIKPLIRLGNMIFKGFPQSCQEIPLPFPKGINESEIIIAKNNSESNIYNF